MFQLGWFSTGRDKAARDLLKTVYDKTKSGKIQAEIIFVFCNRELGESRETDLFLKLVEKYRIPLICFSYHKFKAKQAVSATNQSVELPSWRIDYDREIIKRLADFQPDLCVLAGYMLIVGRELCQKYPMINLHPAAPGGPTGTWQEVIWQLIAANAEKTGVMMHMVTPKLDKGPSVAYCTFPIRGKGFDCYWAEIQGRPVDDIKRKEGENSQLFKLIRQKGLAREFPLIVSTIQAFSEGKIKITPDKKIIDASGKPISGYDLTEGINKVVE